MKTNLTALRGMIETYYTNAATDYGVKCEEITVEENDALFIITREDDNGSHSMRCVMLPIGAYTAEEAFNVWMDAEPELPF